MRHALRLLCTVLVGLLNLFLALVVVVIAIGGVNTIVEERTDVLAREPDPRVSAFLYEGCDWAHAQNLFRLDTAADTAESSSQGYLITYHRGDSYLRVGSAAASPHVQELVADWRSPPQPLQSLFALDWPAIRLRFGDPDSVVRSRFKWSPITSVSYDDHEGIASFGLSFQHAHLIRIRWVCTSL